MESFSKNRSGFGKAVSRILSAPLRAERIICLSSQYPEPGRFRDTRSGQLQGPLFGLAPDGVCRASLLTLRAVVSYTTFSPLPESLRTPAVSSLWHFPSGRLTTSPPACIPPTRNSERGTRKTSSPRHEFRAGKLRGIAPCGVRTFLPRLSPEAILRLSKTEGRISDRAG
jgi:hypothetical protein